MSGKRSGKGDWLGIAIVVYIVVFSLLFLDFLRSLTVTVPAGTLQVACSASGSSPWPLATDPDPGNLYFQLNQDESLHLGLDLPTPAQTSEVLAVEKGTVVRVWNEVEGYGEIIVASDKDPTAGFLYAHVASYEFVPGESGVGVGEPLGLVQAYTGYGCASTSGPCYDHLHLERVGLDPGGATDGVWQQWHTAGNPQAWLTPFGDATPPVLEQLPASARPAGCGSGPLKIALLDDQVDQFVCPDELQDGQRIDVIVRVKDYSSSSSTWGNAPYCARLRVRRQFDGNLVHEHELRLDGPEKEPAYGGPLQYLYRTGSPLPSKAELVGERVLYLVVTNDPFFDGAWPAEAFEGSATNYEITVDVTDAAGNQTTVSIPVTVHP